MRAAIHLPVVERLRVMNYPLYPGSNKQGLDLAFDKGVTVVAGINGIGKTTLLNLLLRMLVGPTSPSKAATRDMGLVSKRSLVNSRKFGFFQDRIRGQSHFREWGQVDLVSAGVGIQVSDPVRLL
jgi:predicted ATPase